MRRRIAPIIVVTVSLLAIIAMLAFLNSATVAGAVTERLIDPTLDISANPASPASAGIAVDSSRQGSFASAGVPVDFAFTIHNDGDALADIYEIEIETGWPAELYQADGETLLNDSDDNGKIDTGLLQPGETISLIARINAPYAASVGDDNRTTLIITSSIDPLVEETILLQSAIPSSFLQAFRDDGLGHPSIFLGQEHNHRSQAIPPHGSSESEIAVAETVSGYVYVWSHQRLESDLYVTEIHSLLIDKQGALTSGSIKVTDHTGATQATHDVNPVVAVDPYGNIAISWQRLRIDQGLNFNNNVYVRVFDQEGFPSGPETNLTNNTQWGIQNTMGFPEFDTPKIAPLEESGFFTAWQRDQYEDAGNIQDIFFATLNGTGNLVISPTNLTNDSPAGSSNVAPALASLSSNRTLVSWVHRETDNDDVYFTVVDYQGDVVYGPEDISEDEQVTDWWNYDAVELSNGSILVAWQAYGCIEGEYTGRIRYAVLGSNYRQMGKPLCMGPDAVAAGGDRGVSVSADADGNAIVTWTDQDPSNRRQLYYSLINRRGDIVTEPLAFYRSDAPGGTISINTQGYANTSRAFIDGVASFSDPLYFVQNGQRARLIIHYGNMGTLSSGAMTLTTILNSNLIYESDTSPVNPTIIGNIITWDFSDLEPTSGAPQFELYSTLPATATVGTTFPVTVTVDLQLTDSNPDNNDDLAQVIVSQPLFLPFLTH